MFGLEQLDQPAGSATAVENVHAVFEPGALQRCLLTPPEEVDLCVETSDLLIETNRKRLRSI